ncbi:murein L,D-transpeptidase [Rhodobacteraceae bacterium CCMM004]|nr:murein L,D-transpeptidase [Rhodobacteraceae bacterium CCMM004]
MSGVAAFARTMWSQSRKSPMSLRLAVLSLPFLAVAAAAAPTPDEIDAAQWSSGDLEDGQTALTVKVQALLDRAGISPGVIDGWKGGMSTSAIAAFERRAGLTPDGVMDGEVWAALGGASAGAIVTRYSVTEEDAQGLVDAIPDDYGERAQMESLGYTRISERLAERFHMDEDFLLALNPGIEIAPGAEIAVIDPGAYLSGAVARIAVDKPTQRLTAFDAEGNALADYPVTIGSADTPSPSGAVEVLGVAIDPTYTYDPEKNFKQGDNDEVLTIPPGANGPVGNVWIDLSKPTYGIHGTAEPSKLFTDASHGCVRMTNWDAGELAAMVSSGVVVEFLE